MSKSYKTQFGDWLHEQLCKVFGEPPEAVTDPEELEELSIK